MILNCYEIFLKTAEIGNITKTAEILHYTQAGLSHAIAALEKETGFPFWQEVLPVSPSLRTANVFCPTYRLWSMTSMASPRPFMISTRQWPVHSGSPPSPVFPPNGCPPSSGSFRQIIPWWNSICWPVTTMKSQSVF